MTSSVWVRDLASYGLQVTLLVGAGALSARLFRFRASAATLVYWQALLGLCLILPVCQKWKAAAPGIAIETKPGLAVPAKASAAFRAPASAARHIPWAIEQTALLIVVGGVLVRGLWLATGFWGLARMRRRSSAFLAELEPVLEDAQQRLGVRAEFRTSEKAWAPITFGLHRPVILLPASVSRMDPETLRAIACHELLHVRRGDWAWCIAEEFVRMVLWFHPAIWWLVGRIRLTREQVVDQAVIELTTSRERYVEALLAVAQVNINARLTPAPLFLRKSLLKQRVAEICKERKMSKRQLILCLALSAGTLVLVARAAIAIFPLWVHAQEQGAPPIQVVQGGENLLHRASLVYPRRAIQRRVEGDVTLGVNVDEQGQVSDARVLSGPEELRRACLQSVLAWRFRAPGSTQVVVRFQLPVEDTPSEIVLPEFPFVSEDAAVRAFVVNDPSRAAAVEQELNELRKRFESGSATDEDKANYERLLEELKAQEVARGDQTTLHDLRATTRENLNRQTEELKGKIADPNTPPEDRARMKKQLKERLDQMAELGDIETGVATIEDERPVSGTLTAIRTERVPQATLAALSPRIGVHVGDTINEEVAKKVQETVHTFDEHFRTLFHPTGEGGLELVIVGP